MNKKPYMVVIKKLDLTITELSKLLNVTRGTINKWIKDGDIIIPAKYCPAVRIKTGVPLSDLNPAVFTNEWLEFENEHWNKK